MCEYCNRRKSNLGFIIDGVSYGACNDCAEVAFKLYHHFPDAPKWPTPAEFYDRLLSHVMNRTTETVKEPEYDIVTPICPVCDTDISKPSEAVFSDKYRGLIHHSCYITWEEGKGA